MAARRDGLLALTLLALAAAPPAMGGSGEVAIVGNGIPEPLTDQPGNPGRGKVLVRDANNVTCLICHRLPIPEEPDQGLLGPDLAGVGSRLSAAELRLRLVDPKHIDPDTIMPSYFRTEGLNRVETQYLGEPIYSAQEIEDVVAYLVSLKGQKP